ncbi:MAG TPA: hypothetical protein VLV16_11915 [Gemmatimonadales bacterium]|nr:hypothetical protein [Gemmatimonadales bacterium]
MDAGMTYLMHWVPTFVAAGVLAIAGFVLMAYNIRDDRRRRGSGGGPRAG